MKQQFYFDLSGLAHTSAGTAIYAWELCHRLMRLAQPLQVIPHTCPFKTLGKSGVERSVEALLRDTLWNNILAGRVASKNDYFIFPNINVPPKFYNGKYGVIVLDLGAWHNRSYLKWRGRTAIQAVPKILNKSQHIFAISDYTAEDVANTFQITKEKIIIAPPGLSDHYKIAKSIQSRKINSININNKYFLHVGTFEPKKNLPFLIKAYEQFRKITGESQETTKLLLTGGEFWNTSDILKDILNSKYADDIIILGKIDNQELPGLYRGAIALVFPSLFEGFGIPVIEALSQGTPVLVNANSSLTQFSEFGATVFDNFDLDIWGNKMKDINEKNNRVEQNYVEKVKENFDWDRTAKIVANAIGLTQN